MVRNKLEKFLKEYLIISILLLASFTQPLGVVIKNDKIIAFGQAIGISPVPWAFTGDENYENFAVEYNISLITKEKDYNFKVDREFSKLMHGPHTNKVFYYNLFSYYATRQNVEIYNKAFDRVVCDKDGFFAEVAHGDDILGIEIEVIDKNKTWSINHVCIR